MKGQHNNMPVKTKKTAGLAVVSHTGKGEDLRISLDRLTEGERVAQRAAHLLARREYGRRALVGMLCHTSHNKDHTKTNVTVFIGRPANRTEKKRGQDGIKGHKIRMYITYT